VVFVILTRPPRLPRQLHPLARLPSRPLSPRPRTRRLNPLPPLHQGQGGQEHRERHNGGATRRVVRETGGRRAGEEGEENGGGRGVREGKSVDSLSVLVVTLRTPS
jgi:hypothetical protein